MNDQRYCVVDVCGTLFSEDTTVGLVGAHVNRTGNVIKRISYLLLTVKFSPFYIAFLLLERLCRQHVYKHVLILFLRGAIKHDLELTANSYLDYLLNCKKQEAVWSRLRLSECEILVLASASLEPFILALASRLNCLYVASELECDSDRYSGRLSIDITGKKVDRLAEKFRDFNPRNISTVVSDNLTDKGLLSLATNPVVVVNRRKDRVRWKNLEAEYLETWV
ncbi:hypothetical protein [Alcanivorax sp.]|uniref:hypothetical protein n=1 Tax=Alcanivorax sp. TaxID=1872427 RepID=UPI0025C37EA8|nr:hypothetical protein [Alcanivorax sp.]